MPRRKAAELAPPAGGVGDGQRKAKVGEGQGKKAAPAMGPTVPGKPEWTEMPFDVALVEEDHPPSDRSPLLRFPFCPFLRRVYFGKGRHAKNAYSTVP